MAKKNKRMLGSLLAASFNTLTSHPIILFPFIIIAFFELFALEIIYFLPRWPLNIIFAPIVRTLWGEQFLHYPINFLLLPKLFYYAQIIIYVICGGFLTAVTCSLIYNINENKITNLRIIFKKDFKKYIDIFCIALITIACFLIFRSLYSVIIKKIALSKIGANISAVTMLKKALVYSSTYVKFFLGVLAETFFAYCFPILIITNKKLLSTLKDNLRFLKNKFLITFLLILTPSSIFLLILYLNVNLGKLIEKTSSEITILLLAAGVILSIFINAWVITLLTSFYLLKKET